MKGVWVVRVVLALFSLLLVVVVIVTTIDLSGLSNANAKAECF